ncbi:MAG: T9SS type A sorting domain-containing protein [Bacteroidia bacterium]|nr:T9SS type A sorting domain-containing protein [Bacteroidia bacterium]
MKHLFSVRILILLFSQLLFTNASAQCTISSVAINELMYRPALSNGVDPNSGEMIELIGPAGTDISYMVLTDGDWTITIPGGTTIPSDGIYTIGNDIVYGTGTFDLNAESCSCFTEGAGGNALLLFTDGGEYLALFSSSGAFIQGLIYGVPSAGNTPPNGANAIAGVINTAGLPGAPASVTIPVAASFETAPGGVASNASLVRNPDGVGSWAVQAGGSINALNFPPVIGTDTRTECSPYVWINGNTYTSNNTTATHVITGGGANGCDSTVTLNLTIKQAATSTDTHSACNTYTWIDGNTYTTNNTTATHVITGGAANGCDSIVTLNLTINTVNTGTTTSGFSISSNASTGSYQWLDCNNNYSVLMGENSALFTPTSSGNYAVEVTENGCVDTSSCVSVSTVGIYENANEKAFSIYPNPTEDHFMIDLGTNCEMAIITISDITGKVISSEKYSQVQLINVSFKQAPGIYLLNIDNGSQKSMIRLIKK